MASMNVGDLVWAKMKGFPAWPARIVEPNDLLKKLQKTEHSKCVYFFGSHNNAWIEENALSPYLENKKTMEKLGCKKANFLKAVKECELYMNDPEASGIITTPARQTTVNVVVDALDDTVNTSTASFPEEASPMASPVKTPNTKVPVVKRSQKKQKASENHDEVPAKRSRASNNQSPRSTHTNNNNNIETNDHAIKNEYASPIPRARAARAVIDRPAIFEKNEVEELDVTTVSETLLSKKITPSTSKFGFIGLGIMGSGIVKNLLNSGHSVCVFNRTHEKTEKFRNAGAEVMLTPSDVIENADITFSCVADPNALQTTIFGPYGVSTLDPAIARGKSYVEMTTIDTTTSKDIESALRGIGMNYLEAQIQGTKSQAEEGKLILLAAGEKSLFDACQTCFEAMGRNSFFVGETGNATKMNLVLQTIAGVQIAGLADSIALAEKAGLNTETYMNILGSTNMCSQLVMEKGLAMIDNRFSNVNLPLMHMQKDLRLAMNMSDALNLPMPLTAVANEAYKNARRLGLAESDASAICYRARH